MGVGVGRKEKGRGGVVGRGVVGVVGVVVWVVVVCVSGRRRKVTVVLRPSQAHVPRTREPGACESMASPDRMSSLGGEGGEGGGEEGSWTLSEKWSKKPQECPSFGVS